MLVRYHRLLALAVFATLASCDGGDSPLSPAGDAPAGPEGNPIVAAPETAEAPVQTLASLASPRIAFASNLTGNGDIYLMDSYGKQLTRLTTFSTYETKPAWSWDNTRIAMVRPRKDASNVTHTDIYIIKPDGTNGHWWRSTPTPYDLDDPSWSPDGSTIVVTAAVQGTWYVAYLNLPGRYVGFLRDETSKFVTGKEPSFSPTGDRIVYVGSGSTTLDVMGANGYQHQTLLYNPQQSINYPVFSPDGKRIALSMTDTDGHLQIFVRNADASLKRLTASTTVANLSPSWSPDGSKIAFRRGDQIWTMSATGGSQTRLHVSSYDVSPAFSH
jgi:Tol biopolymer transport system component